MFDGAGISAVAINGGMGIHERAVVQAEFRERARVLVSTDAGGEGINLQFTHAIVNYDLPWSPSRIEQRIGRVDRIGQTHPVQAINLAMEHSVDARVLEVLETKLAVILAELGADKAGDILNSADRHAEGLYAAAIAGEDIAAAGDRFEMETREETEHAASFFELIEPAVSTPTIGGGDDPQVWIDKALPARAAVRGEPTVWGPILETLPEVSPAEPVPAINGTRGGLFSLWEVAGAGGVRTCVPVFVTDDGAARPDIADRVWDSLVTDAVPQPSCPLSDDEWDELWDTGWSYAVRPDQPGDAATPPPGLVLRLLVRVTS
jgi:hypothetical protein